MCEWHKYGSFRIDPCMKEKLRIINYLLSFTGDKTIASCCGHGIYRKTILIQRKNGMIVEYYTQTIITNKPRKSKRYYKRDKNGIFYIPEVSEPNEGVLYER